MEDAEPHAHYSRGEERDRLSAGQGLLEFTRTTEIILQRRRQRPSRPGRGGRSHRPLLYIRDQAILFWAA